MHILSFFPSWNILAIESVWIDIEVSPHLYLLKDTSLLICLIIVIHIHALFLEKWEKCKKKVKISKNNGTKSYFGQKHNNKVTMNFCPKLSESHSYSSCVCVIWQNIGGVLTCAWIHIWFYVSWFFLPGIHCQSCLHTIYWTLRPWLDPLQSALGWSIRAAGRPRASTDPGHPV